MPGAAAAQHNLSYVVAPWLSHAKGQGSIQAVNPQRPRGGNTAASPAIWHLYVIRTVTGALYAGITTDVKRRYQEHLAGGPKAARFLRANPPKQLVLKRRIGPRPLALKVEYWFKQLPKRRKKTIVLAGQLRFDRVSGKLLPDKSAYLSRARRPAIVHRNLE